MFIKCDKKDWGKGIPEYTNEDLMTARELYDFVLDVVCQCESKNAKILQANPSNTGYPSIVMEIDGILSFVLVEAAIAPDMPTLNSKRRINLIKQASKFNADCYYAAVGFGASDPTRFDKSLALKGDSFYANYLGLEEINGMSVLPDIKDYQDYKNFVTCLFGLCYERKCFDPIYEFIADDCKWYSFFSGIEYTTKDEIIAYYEDKEEAIQETNIKSYLIQFKGDYFKIKHGNDIIYVPQPNNEVGLLLEQEMHGQKNGLIIALKFNDEGLINDIYLGDPYLMEFKDYA